MLDDTLVVWGGEFGRTVYSQGTLTDTNYGRDHHPRCFSVWMAGGGIKGGVSYGETDEFSYNIVENEMDVHDLHATIMHCLGVDHTKLTFKFQGRHYRLTDVQGYNSSNVLQSHLHYTYDVFNRLIEKQVDPTGGGTYATAQSFVYDGNDMILVYNGSGTLTDRLLNGPGANNALADENGSK